MPKRSNVIEVRDPVTNGITPVSPQRAARLTGVTVRTAERWAAGSPMPEPSRRLLTILALGLMPHRDWWAYRVHGSALRHLETGITVTPGEIQGVYAAWAEADALRRKLREGRVVRYFPTQKKPGSKAGHG